VRDDRIAAGVALWREHRELLDAIALERQVSPEYVLAILGVETRYGRQSGRYRVLDALATLAFDYPPRADYFRAELAQFLLLSREEGLSPLSVKGSYAGAMGYPQFMPRSYRAYAADGDGDGRRDLWANWDDAIASVANYLASHGWRAGEPVLAPADLPDPDEARGLIAGSIVADSTIDSLRSRGLVFYTTLCGDAPALFIEVAGDHGPERLAGFHNFSVITRYNRSVLYALAVNSLGAAVEARLPRASAL
jgi:membrane-bound lytic murein transglycosylase B